MISLESQFSCRNNSYSFSIYFLFWELTPVCLLSFSSPHIVDKYLLIHLIHTHAHSRTHTQRDCRNVSKNYTLPLYCHASLAIVASVWVNNFTTTKASSVAFSSAAPLSPSVSLSVCLFLFATSGYTSSSPLMAPFLFLPHFCLRSQPIWVWEAPPVVSAFPLLLLSPTQLSFPTLRVMRADKLCLQL